MSTTPARPEGNWIPSGTGSRELMLELVFVFLRSAAFHTRHKQLNGGIECLCKNLDISSLVLISPEQEHTITSLLFHPLFTAPPPMCFRINFYSLFLKLAPSNVSVLSLADEPTRTWRRWDRGLLLLVPNTGLQTKRGGGGQSVCWEGSRAGEPEETS